MSPPVPTYKPHLPRHIVAQGLLSEAQLESVIYAGLAHSGFLTEEAEQGAGGAIPVPKPWSGAEHGYEAPP
ncbi:MAG: strawberry notch-like NTP hydrolase domain-containing protein [Nostoc sp.]